KQIIEVTPLFCGDCVRILFEADMPTAANDARRMLPIVNRRRKRVITAVCIIRREVDNDPCVVGKSSNQLDIVRGYPRPDDLSQRGGAELRRLVFSRTFHKFGNRFDTGRTIPRMRDFNDVDLRLPQTQAAEIEIKIALIETSAEHD